VEKLSVAMDSAEKELEAAFSRNGDLNRAASSRKDAELGEGLYKLSSVGPQLESAWFQRLKKGACLCFNA
jgi:hypothetical protein